MKKIFLFAVFFCLISMAGCSSTGVPKGQMISDLNVEFKKDGLDWEIESASINLHSKDKKHNSIELTANIHTGTAILTRMYKMEYDYYEVGGWVLTQYTGVHEEQWEATPTVLVSTELITDTIFTEEKRGFVGGHVIQPHIQNAHFEQWSRRGGSNQDTNYVKAVEYPEKDLENRHVTVLAHCKASSPMLEIQESFKLTYTFNPLTLCWELVSGQSMNHSYNFLEDISGTYAHLWGTGQTKEFLTFSKSGDKITVCGDLEVTHNHFDNANVNIDGAFVLSAMGRHLSYWKLPTTFVVEGPDRLSCVPENTGGSLFIKE